MYDDKLKLLNWTSNSCYIQNLLLHHSLQTVATASIFLYKMFWNTTKLQFIDKIKYNIQKNAWAFKKIRVWETLLSAEAPWVGEMSCRWEGFHIWILFTIEVFDLKMLQLSYALWFVWQDELFTSAIALLTTQFWVCKFWGPDL